MAIIYFIGCTTGNFLWTEKFCEKWLPFEIVAWRRIVKPEMEKALLHFDRPAIILL